MEITSQLTAEEKRAIIRDNGGDKEHLLAILYELQKTEPKARYVLKVCNSTPCHFSRSEEIAQILKEELGVGIGETTEDGVFAYHYIPCVGACDIGPVIKVKDTVYGNLDRRKIRQLLADLRSGKRNQ